MDSKWKSILIVCIALLNGCGKATVTPPKYAIAATAIGKGTMSPSGVSTVDSAFSIKFLLIPDPGHHIDSVYVDERKCDSVKSYTFSNVVSNHVIVVFFSIDKVTITTSVVGSGSIFPRGELEVGMGENQAFKFTPDSGHHMDSIHVDGAKVDSAATLTITNATANHQVTGYFSPCDNAIQFDGRGSNVRFPSYEDLRLQTLTLEMWIRVDTFVDPVVPFLWETKLDHYISADGFSAAFEDRHVIFRAAQAPNMGASVGAVFTPEPGDWFHFAGTFDGDTLTVIINGNLIAKEESSDRIYYGRNGFSLGIGQHSLYGGENCFRGLMDEIRIWNYPRSLEQIQESMNSRLKGNEAGLVAYWNCDQEAGSRTLLDKTSYHHDGVLKGNITFVPSDALPSKP